MTRTPAGKFTLRIVVLRRVLGTQQASGEIPETFPDPAAGTGEYFAFVETAWGDEVIIQGQRHSVGGMRLRIKGASIAIAAFDRIRKKITGEEYAVRKIHREEKRGETVVDVERVIQQATPQ